MENLYISPTSISPEINFSPENNVFIIKGISAPEDVRALYYPVIEWIRKYVDTLILHKGSENSGGLPFIFKVDLTYFNSSSAKFLYDIFMEMQRLVPTGIPFVVEWIYDKEDIDLMEAGSEIALLAGMDFTFTAK